MNLRHIVGLLVIAGLIVSCVPNRKFLEVQDTNVTLSDQLRECQAALDNSNDGTSNRLAEIKQLKKDVAELQKDTTLRGERYRSITKLNREMERLCEKIRLQNDQLIAEAASGKRESDEALSKTRSELNTRERELIKKEGELNDLKNSLNKREQDNTTLQNDLKERERKMADLEADLKNREEKTAALQADLKDREAKVGSLTGEVSAGQKRVQELESMINRQKDQATALRSKLNQALTGFNASELSVEQRDGKVYVSLSQELLFKSGSKTIDPKGKQALATLAGVLNRNIDTDIMIEGHTDDVGEANSNWDLSVMRATSVVRELTTNSVDPKRITAAGRGEFFPKADNSTSTGKAMNRRTEIILSPKLNDLYQLIGN